MMKKSELDALNDAQRAVKIAEIERAMLELRGEGRKDKVKPLRKTIARLKTPKALKKAKTK